MTTASVLLRDDEQDTHRRVETACELINEWLCITPEVAGFYEEQSIVFSGRFVVTHIPSGWTASRGGGCIECARYLGRVLTALDWANAPSDISRPTYTGWLNGHDPEVVSKVGAALDLSWLCDADDCEPRQATS